MQRFPAFLLTLLALLYGATVAFATRAQSIAPPAAAKPLPAQAVTATKPEANLQTNPPKPHIALILPLKSEGFGNAAELTRQGFLAAASHQGNTSLPIKTYATTEQIDEILSAYQLALAAEAQVVVGPLTRDGVSALARSGMVRVPTLALNLPDDFTALPANLFTLSLHVENEAQQAASLAAQEGRRKALIITTDTPLSQRMQQAFADAWQKLGGVILQQLVYISDPGGLQTLRQAVTISGADTIFLALDARRARLVRPYLDANANIYATSQIFSGNTQGPLNFDLNGIRFVDMPWVLQSDHPAVMIYPRPNRPVIVDLERLYALGIDAYRIAQDLLNARPGLGYTLDGVTGQITLNAENQFVRELLPAMFYQGQAVVLYEPKR
ncbi:MAG TPA: penicillin-binding protein activator [Burkholderiales bacterium]|nr:penicillin-binding protein activator [Burkholderiales bacterium]